MVDGGPNGVGKKRLFEPVFNLGSITIILGLCTGGLAAFYNLKADFAAQSATASAVKEMLNERASNVDRQLNALTAGVESINALIAARTPQRYTRDDAQRDFGAVNGRLDSHEQRIQNLERRR